MTLPDTTMAEIIMQNQQRMERMMNNITSHVTNDHYFGMTKWSITKHNGIALLLQGVLMSTMEYEYMEMYPKGLYHCSSCKQQHYMSHDAHCFFNATTSSIVCATCRAEDDTCVKAYVEHLKEEDIGSAEYCEFIDMRMTDEELQKERQVRRDTVSKVNELPTTEFMYMDDKTIEDIREEILAKRVLRKLQAKVKKRRQLNTFKVLYHCVGIGMDASIMLAKQTAC